MWSVVLDRQSVYQILQLRGPSNQKLLHNWDFGETPLKPGNLIAAWDDEARPTGFPQLLVVPDEEVPDFFAWSAGYMTWLRPLSAHVRILGVSAASTLQRHRPDVVPPRLASACLGLILGEAVAHAEGSVDIRTIPTLTFLRTMGFAFTRSFAVGRSVLGLDVQAAWMHARTVTRQPQLAVTPFALRSPWDAIDGFWAGQRSLIPEVSGDWSHVVTGALQQIADTGEVSRTLWSRLAEGRRDVLSAIESLGGTAEERFRALMRALESGGAERAAADPIRSFLIAYLASRVTPGVMAHLELLHGHAEALPGVELWYGLCCGLSPESSVRESANGLGALIMKEALRPFSVWDAPFADISLLELDLMSDSNRLPQVRGLLPGCLTVELAPGVCSVLRWPPGAYESQRLARSPSAVDSSSAALRAVAASLDAIAREVADLERGAKTHQPRRTRGRKTPS